MNDNELHFAPVGRYMLAFDENGNLLTLDTLGAGNTVTIPLPSENITPELFVTPYGSKALVDDAGNLTYTTDAARIINEEHNKSLNPYALYLKNLGVAPKDPETEHLMQRHRANQAGERADLSPFFANLMTGMYAGAAEAGWDDIKKGNYFSGASEVLSPLMFGENAWNKVAQGLYGGIHFLNENGVPKTWREIKEGNYGNAALSGAGDVFNLALTGPITRRPRIYLSNLLGLSKRSPKVSERIVFDVDKNSEYYKQLVNRYGEKLANEIIEKFKTKEFQDYFLAGDLESAQREISDYALIRDTDDLIRGNPDMGKGALTGSSAVASKGTIHRPSAVSHDLDYAVYSTNPLKNIYGGTQEEVKSALDLLFGNPKESIINSPAFLNFVQTFNLENAPVFNIPRWLPRWMVPRDKTGAIYLTPMFNVGNGGINRTVQTTVNGVPIDLFFGGNYIPEGPIKGIVDASIPLGWKRQWVNATKYPREKDLRDLKEYMDFGPDNPLIDLRTRQSLYSPFMFGNRITTPEGYPIILEIETYTGSGTTIPVTMNHKGQFQIINNGISKTVQPNGTIKLSLPSHTNSKPRQFVLEPAGDNKYYVHMKVWDDIKNKVPGNISNEEKLQLFEALYNELPEGAEILMPKSSSEYLATRGTVAGLQRLSRDSRFTPGTKGTLLYKDRDGSIKTYNGSSFIKGVRGIEGGTTLESTSVTTPQSTIDPLATRMERMLLRQKLKEQNPEIYSLIYNENNPFVLPNLSISIVPKIRYNNVRKAMKQIDPELSEADLDMGVQIALANKKGVHFDIGNKSGDTIGGVNLVEIEDAVNMVRRLHGRDAIPYDIRMIAGHEFGHGVQLSEDALNAVSGYYDPYEFYTQAGQILDNAGLINTTTNPINYNKFMNLVDNYLKSGNLDNGISKLRNYLKSVKDPILRLIIMKNINRFSVGILGMYGIKQLANNIGNGEIL